MKKQGFVFALLAMAVACGCTKRGSKTSADAPLLRVRFAGASQVNEGTNATKLKDVLALQSTTNLLNEIFAKVARAPHEVWRKSLPPGATDQAHLFRPLLDDLWNNESHIELRGSPARLDLIIGVHLDERRAQLWNTNLWQIAAGWKLGEVKPASKGPPSSDFGATGWRSTGKGPTDGHLNLHCVRSGNWSLVAFTHEARSPLDSMAALISRSNRPFAAFQDQLLEFESDWPRLRQAFPLAAKLNLPRLQLTIRGKDDHLRTEGKLIYSDSYGGSLPSIKLEPWKIPTNLVTEPLISFTCARGIAPLLDGIKGYSQLKMKNPPNQFFLWDLGTDHVQAFLAVPMHDPTNVIKELAPRLPAFFTAQVGAPVGQFFWISNRSEWIWGGLPAVIPHLRPARADGADYIFAALFPMGARSNTAPAELFQQVLNRTNLIYYDWELTQERLPHARQIFQLWDIIHQRRLQQTNMTAQRWLLDLRPHMGNSITEITLASPRELSLVRKSNIGLTGFELALLARWLNSPGFPLRYEPPPSLLSSSPTNRPPLAHTNSAPATNKAP